MSKDYFKTLGNIAKTSVPQELDEAILTKVRGRSSGGLPIWQRLSIGISMALITLVIGVNIFDRSDDRIGQQVPVEIIQNAEFYENLELLGEVDGVDLTKLSDEEWQILLGESEDV